MSDIDERLKRGLEAGRGSRSSTDNRQVSESREATDRTVTEDRQLSEADRLEMFRKNLFQDALPDLPPIPGYHVCWLTTANPRDPIHRRVMLGYEPIKAADIPGFEFASLKTGEWSGCVGVNEMIAFKLPLSLYESFMQEAHHDAPAREEQRLQDVADMLREQAAASKTQLIEEDGTRELGRNQPARGRFAA